MNIQFNRLFEHNCVEYTYSAALNTGCENDFLPGRIIELDRADGEPLDEDHWEEVEFYAMKNARLVLWCEEEGWHEENLDDKSTALIKQGSDGTCQIIMRVNEKSVPQTLDEPIILGVYNEQNGVIQNTMKFEGGILHFEQSRYRQDAGPYSKIIKRIAVKLGYPHVNPRWIEGFIRIEHPTLNGLSDESFVREVKTAILCIQSVGPGQAEECAQSFGL